MNISSTKRGGKRYAIKIEHTGTLSGMGYNPSERNISLMLWTDERAVHIDFDEKEAIELRNYLNKNFPLTP